MHRFRVYVETDGEGSSWWCEDGLGFVAVASNLPRDTLAGCCEASGAGGD